MAVQNFVIRCKKCYASLIMLSSSFKACLHQRNCLAQQIQSDFHKQIICSDMQKKTISTVKMSTFIIFIRTNTVVSNSEWVIVVAVSLVLDLLWIIFWLF